MTEKRIRGIVSRVKRQPLSYTSGNKHKTPSDITCQMPSKLWLPSVSKMILNMMFIIIVALCDLAIDKTAHPEGLC